MNTLWLPLLLGSVVWAEDQYFPQSTNATWDEARLHCQSCFRELTTVTSMNVHLIVQNLSCAHYWVGLRRNDSFPWLEWSAWSNEDPVTYQNWYPGHPVPNKEKKLIPICPSTTESPSSTLITTTTSAPMTSLETSTVTSAPVTSLKTSTMWSTKEEEQEEDTCPLLTDMLECLNMTCFDLESVMATCNRTTVTPKTTTYNTTPEVTTFSTTFSTATTEDTTTEHLTTEDITTESPTTERTTTSNCIFEPEPDPEQYIEDACVVLLRFGMWKEEDCNTSLPYICYEERFFGRIDVFDKKTNAANLSWSEGPGAENISHYRVEITGDKNQTFNQTDLFEYIQNLTAGTLYSVQVFPVKCGRDLNPQNISFYTQPADVQNLTIVSMTTASANLEWSKPEGNREFYSVTFRNDSKDVEERCDSENCTIKGLIPGTEYTFTVKAVVNKTFGGVESNVSNYTIPSTVRKLTATNNDSTAIIATWVKPVGGHSEYYYCFKQVNNNLTCLNCINIITNCKYTPNEFLTESDNIIDGSKFCLCVAALAKNNISGEMVQIPAYTLPKMVNLSLDPKSQVINANWTLDKGHYETFELTIKSTAYDYLKQYNTTDFNFTFTGLKAGVYYTVSVITRNGHLNSTPAEMKVYTRPAQPTELKAVANKTTVDLTWKAPAESDGANINYTVTYNSSFWMESASANTNDTKLSFYNLRPGTRYDFNVRVVVGNSMSDPATGYASTDPVKRTLTLTMLCSSVTSLQCNKTTTQEELFKKLKDTFTEKFQDMVHWKLRWTKKGP